MSDPIDEATRRSQRRALRNVGVQAARSSRALLATAIASLEEGPIASDDTRALASQLSFAVAALFGAEVGEPEAVRDRLRDASAVLSGVLARMHGIGYGPALEEVGETIARTLAVLYPVRAGLERELADTTLPLTDSPSSPDAAPPPMLFEKPLPRARPTLEIVREPRPSLELVPEEAETEAEADADAATEAPTDPEPDTDDDAAPIELGAERRIAPRVEFAVDIGLHSATEFFAGVSGDLSEGGLFVATYTPLALGTQLVVSFVLPDGHHVTTPGVVAWLQEPDGIEGSPHPGMGVRFSQLGLPDQAAIDRFLLVRPPMLHE